MHFTQLLSFFFLLTVVLMDIAHAHGGKHHNNPGPTCGAPFCARSAIAEMGNVPAHVKDDDQSEENVLVDAAADG